MDLSQITKLTFWASEYSPPLFWLTNPKRKVTIVGALFLFHDPVVHAYYLNDRLERESAQGFSQFSRPEAFAEYIEEAQKLKDKMKQTEISLAGSSLEILSDEALALGFETFMEVAAQFNATYAQTEAYRFQRFESTQDQDLKHSLLEIGKVRFGLRQASESFFGTILNKLHVEIKRRYGIKAEDWFLYTYPEVQSLFSGFKVDARIIALRRSGYALLNLDGESELLVGKDFQRLVSLVEEKTPQSANLEGSPAFPGKVRGLVELVLHDTHDLLGRAETFTEGRILVTEMTTPAMLMACRKSAAIVTDEGGILCHAAIIARELKKPCIVGTKHATRVLKDGDEVELDAEKGTIELLNRAP